MDIKELLTNKSFLIIVGIFVGYGILLVFFLSRKKKKNKRWLRDNPNASKVYIKGKGGQLWVTSVDGEKIRSFMEGVKHGFYVTPGEHIIEASYETTRPGMVHKTVTTTYGPSKLKIMIEENRNYEIYFNTGNKNFVFFEIGAQEKLEAIAAERLKKVKEDIDNYAKIYNYINVDSIDDKALEEYPVELSKKKKGKWAPQIEIIYLESGEYTFVAHGTTYQTTPVRFTKTIDAGKFYCLGANQEEVYLDERPFEWTKDI